MGFWGNIGNVLIGAPISQPQNLGSPFAQPNNLEQAIITDFFGEMSNEIVTEDLAMRVPEVNRALQAHLALVAPLKHQVYQDGEIAADQPAWINNSASGISPFIRWTGCVRDLFFYGWALLGAELGADGLPRDLMHIPRKLWSTDSEGKITVDDTVPTKYRQRLILIPLGTNGLLADGADSIRQARKLEQARQARLDAPPAATELHITDSKYDEMTREEKAEMVRGYVANRNKHSVAVTPSYVDVKERGTTGDLDLFESAMNSLRIQIANHSGVPASFVEGGKEGGSNGAMTYTNSDGRVSELWVFGSHRYALAILARLSMDDVVGPNAEVRADLSQFMIPTPDQTSAESSIPVPVAPTVNDQE